MDAELIDARSAGRNGQKDYREDHEIILCNEKGISLQTQETSKERLNMLMILDTTDPFDKDQLNPRICDTLEIKVTNTNDQINVPCWLHKKDGYKKGCKDCFDANRSQEWRNDEPDYPDNFNNWDH
jgi:hypothetical protein